VNGHEKWKRKVDTMENEKGKVIQFPFKGNKNTKEIKIDDTGIEVHENVLFTENLTEGLIINMIHNMSENGIDVDRVEFIQDTSLLIEMVKSMIYRNFGMGHPMQKFSELFVSAEIDGKKMEVTVDTEFMKTIAEDLLGDEDKE